MGKGRVFGSVLLTMVLALSGMIYSDKSLVSANESVVSIDAGVSKDSGTEIASQIFNAKEGTTVVLKEGYYVISNQAYLKENNITLKGAGKDKTYIFVKSADEGWGLTVSGNYCTLQDLTIERSTNPNNAAVIKVYGGNNALIKNVKTIGGYYGIDLNPTMNTVINGCEFTKTSKASIGVGGANNKQSEVTILNTITSNAGWKADIALNDNATYGNSKVIIGENNQFKNGCFYTENHTKSDYVLDEQNFPKYKTTIIQEKKFYTEIAGIKLSESELKLDVGKTNNISGLVSPANPTREITWYSSDKNVAIVDEKGKVTAISKGNATITATSGEASATCLVTVFKIETDIPTIDTSEPTDKVNVGITDNDSTKVISDTSSNIIDSIINNETISPDVISKKTMDNVRTAIENGSTITTKVETKMVQESEIAKEDLTKISDTIEKMTSQNNKGVKVAQYLDIGVLLEAQNGNTNQELGNIYQLDKAITFTVVVPNDMKVDGRKFYVLRIHNEETTILDAILNSDGTLSFATDCFSTYALVFEDKTLTDSSIKPTQPDNSHNNGGESTNKGGDSSTDNPKNNPPKTSDSTDINIFITMLASSFICIISSYYKEKYNR